MREGAPRRPLSHYKRRSPVTSRSVPSQTRPPLWRNATFLKWAAQLGVLGLTVAAGSIALSVATRNLAAQGRRFTWDFLTDPPGIQLPEGIATHPATGLEALISGVVSMLRVTVSGVVAATVIGVLVGISRLSGNWLLRQGATAYVETLRNVPLLVQIVFWFFLCTLFFPVLPDTISGPLWLVFSRSGISIPWLYPTATFWQWLATLMAGGWAARLVRRRRIARQELTGLPGHGGRWAVAVFLASAVTGWFAHPLFGVIGVIWSALAGVMAVIPPMVWQIGAAVTALGAAFVWIRRFLGSFRSPAGRARLTDDDVFRVGVAGLMGVAAAVFFLRVPGVTETIVGMVESVFRFLDTRFDFLRSGPPLRFARPEIVKPGNFARIGPQGMTITPAFFGLWVGVTLYTAAFIGEIVRGGILAVPKGQAEAAASLGLNRRSQLRLVVLPQAFRIILPPLGNQYLNLAKNTSLGIAIAYPEVVMVGQTLLNQTGQAIQVSLLWMAFYLAVSLVLSTIVNHYNRRLRLVER